MKKIVMLVIVGLLMGGCGLAGKIDAKVTGYSERCVDNVMYLQFASGVTVAYNTDGTVKVCE